MSCWVVPTVAAELWNVPVNDVLARIRRGILASKSEYGFMLVDVAPESPVFRRPPHRSQPRPLTFKPAPREAAPAAFAGDEWPEPCEDEPATVADDSERLDWKAARLSAGRLRRPPKLPHLAA